MKWSYFITDDRYKDEGIGVYEGALTYSSGAYRPTQKSIMTSTETEFNAPSREAIWYRINKLTQGEGWEGTHEDFVAFDQQVMPARVQARRAPNEKAGSRILRGALPIVKGHTWRMEKYSIMNILSPLYKESLSAMVAVLFGIKISPKRFGSLEITSYLCTR